MACICICAVKWQQDVIHKTGSIRYALHCRQRRNEPRATPTCNTCRKFHEVWTCRFWDMRAGRQTDAKMAILRMPPGGKVISILTSVRGQPPQYFTKPSRPTQPPTLSGTGNEYQPKCSDALWLGSKGRYRSFHLWINVWVAGKTVISR